MSAMKKIRLLIVDDSVFFRTALEKALKADDRVEVIGTAVDTNDAMAKIEKLEPDVVTLDVEMPGMSGIDFLKQLMPKHPTPVVVVSSLPIRVLDALDAGAVDFVRKPQIQSSSDMKFFLSELSVKIRIASAAQAGRLQRPATPRPAAPLPAQKLSLNSSACRNCLIAIGASTGGTEAILEVVRDLPATTPGIVVVQHMPPVFTKLYAERLDRTCHMSVKEAENGDRVEPGKIIIGAGGFHLRVMKDRQGFYVKSEPGEKVSGHCPSVDVLFESVAALGGAETMGILLTGMGADGAGGLLKMRKAGSYTVGQDKDSCVVYGMPMVAFNIGAVTKQLPIQEIGAEIIRHINDQDCCTR